MGNIWEFYPQSWTCKKFGVVSSHGIFRKSRFGSALDLSPRVRGNQDMRNRYLSECGSIPACAGEPRKTGGFRHCRKVYPRVCGGTEREWAAGLPGDGLSPRVRGNPAPPAQPPVCWRSIPACAGEPMPDDLTALCVEVYPRVCGGTTNYVRPRPSSSEEVYPRVCGGTDMREGEKPTHGGLSPRVRGNRDIATKQAYTDGSIPACAGEPHVPLDVVVDVGVYPRVCGGTSFGSGRRYFQ